MKKQATQWSVLGECGVKGKAFDLIRDEKKRFPRTYEYNYSEVSLWNSF